jgi:hypothetical protein
MDILTVVSSVVPRGAATEGAVTFRFECDDGEHMVSDLREAQREHTMAEESAAAASPAAVAPAVAAAAAAVLGPCEAVAAAKEEATGGGGGGGGSSSGGSGSGGSGGSGSSSGRGGSSGRGAGNGVAVAAVEDLLVTQQHVMDATHPAAARLVTRLRRFSLADAHCFDPNEERQLRATIDAMPGGAKAFQATIRRLGARFDDLVHSPTPGSAAGKAEAAHGMANLASADFSYSPASTTGTCR